MSDIELIDKLIKSKKPSDIFPDDWKKPYLTYSKLIHPDSCGLPNAGNAMAIMNHYKDVIENGTPYADEAGPFRVFEKKIVYAVTDANKKLISKSVDYYKKLMSLHDKASENFHKYLPESMVLEKDCLTITLKDRVVRAYQTRHGNGYMSNEGISTKYIKPNPTETNVDTGNQGTFRKSVLDFDLLSYAISCDRQHNTFYDKKLVITCLDQIDGDKIPITKGNELHLATPKEIGQWLNIPVITSNSDEGFLHDLK